MLLSLSVCHYLTEPDGMEPRQQKIGKQMMLKVSKSIIICMIAVPYTVGVVCVCGHSPLWSFVKKLLRSIVLAILLGIIL